MRPDGPVHSKNHVCRTSTWIYRNQMKISNSLWQKQRWFWWGPLSIKIMNSMRMEDCIQQFFSFGVFSTRSFSKPYKKKLLRRFYVRNLIVLWKNSFWIYFSWSKSATSCILREERDSFSDKTRLKFVDDGAVGAVLLETDKSLVKRRAKKRIALKAFPILDILWPEFCLWW